MWVSVFEDDDEALAIWRDEVFCSGHLLKVMLTLADDIENIGQEGYDCPALFCGTVFHC